MRYLHVCIQAKECSMFWSICFYFVLFACLSHGQTASCQVLSNELVLQEVLNGMKGCQPVSGRFKYISLTSKELCDLRVVHNFVESPSDVAVVVVVQAKLPSSQHRPTLSHKFRPCLPQYLTRLLHQLTKCHHVRAALWLARLHRMRFKKAEKKNNEDKSKAKCLLQQGCLYYTGISFP